MKMPKHGISADEVSRVAMDGQLPSRMAAINHILNELPPPVADQLFRLFYNELSRPESADQIEDKE